MKPNKNKTQLLKSILDMKFMKKTKAKVEKEFEDTQGHNDLYSNIITTEMRQASGNFISEQSYLFCEDLIEGRVSFKGMNPDIERLMELENLKKQSKEENINKDVSDELLAKKFQSLKRHMKPSDTTDCYAKKKRK